MDDEPTAGTSDSPQQAVLDAMREILTPLVEQPPKRKRGRPRKDRAASGAVPAHLSRDKGSAPDSAVTPDAITPRSVPPNALTHGLSSNAVVIPGVESQEEWQAFRDGIIADLNPEGAVQHALSVRIASLFWRLDRVSRFESDTIAANIDAVEVDYNKGWGFYRGSLKEAVSARDAAERHLDILRGLPGMPLGTQIDGEDADAVLELLGDDDDIELPPQLVDYVEGRVHANGTLLMIAAKTIAEGRGRPLEDLFESAISAAEKALDKAAENVDYATTTHDRMRRERHAPPESFIRTAGRYEAQLDRALHRAMTQLETLKAAREGRPISLTRIHVEH